MDPFKPVWSAEGCGSSESGWTMYIASPMQEDDSKCTNDDHEYDDDIYGRSRKQKQKQKQREKVEDAESDDSMASDASSGPVHYQHSKGGHGTVASQRDKMDQGSKCSSRKNGNKQEKKSVDGRSKK